jgi:hypothetical protein
MKRPAIRTTPGSAANGLPGFLIMSIIDDFKDILKRLERNTQRDEARANSCDYCHGRGWVRPLKNGSFVPCPKCNGSKP